MTEVSAATSPPDPPDPPDPFRTMAGTTLMQLTVVESARISPNMQRLVLTAPELADFGYLPGQDIMLLVDTADGGRPVRRRYSIKALDRHQRLLTLDIVRHTGGGPGERWVQAAEPGVTVEGIGPRGKISPDPGADWHLFVGDESAMAAIFSMAQSLPAQAAATVILEVPEPADEQEIEPLAKVEVIWLPRLGAHPAGEAGALVEATRAVEIPSGPRPHAYLIGEARVVLALRDTLEQRGLDPGVISPKAYWGRGKSNASHGEPARDQR
jgi:NADPH-dependent ferric siderophore reductase